MRLYTKVYETIQAISSSVSVVCFSRKLSILSVIKFITIKLLIISLYNCFNICTICNDITSLISDISNLCVFSFFLISMVSLLILFINNNHILVFMIYVLHCFFVYCFINLHPDLCYFLFYN